MKIGGGEDVAWLQICEPTEKDKGNYTFEIFGAKESYKRTLDLSGQGVFIVSHLYGNFSWIKQNLLAIVRGVTVEPKSLIRTSCSLVA